MASNVFVGLANIEDDSRRILGQHVGDLIPFYLPDLFSCFIEMMRTRAPLDPRMLLEAQRAAAGAP